MFVVLIGMNDKEPPDGGGNTCPVEMDIEKNTRSDLAPGSRKRNNEDTVVDMTKRATNLPASASVQHKYTVPEFASGSKHKYSATDNAPFMVHVARTVEDPSSGSSIRILKLAQLLHKNSVRGIKKGGIKPSGRNRVIVEFVDANFANAFLDNPVLAQHNYTASIPTFNVTRMGLIRNIPVDWTM